MDVKDLMIGDWVICNDLKRQVAAIGETVGFLDCNNQVYWAYEGFDRIDPIPLTEDILMKNGWRKEPITIDGDYANWHGEIPISQAEDEYNYADIELRYAHQLQHLLRLCGVEKELVID